MHMSNTNSTTTVWRLKTKPPGFTRSERQALIHKMLNEGFIGTGWPIQHSSADDLTRESSIALIKAEYPKKHAVPRRFVKDTKIGDLVWIVDLDGCYHLGTINNEYRYVPGNTKWERELSHQFPCDWVQTGLLSSDVPSGVINGLLRGQTYSRIKDPSATRYTAIKARNETFEAKNEDEFLELIDHEALEDLVGLYLQFVLDGVMIPSSGKRSNAAYEFVIVSKSEDRKAIVQVKSGTSKIANALESDDAECYLFALSGIYPTELGNNKIISKETLIDFAYRNRTILPSTIKCWMKQPSAEQHHQRKVA